MTESPYASVASGKGRVFPRICKQFHHCHIND